MERISHGFLGKFKTYQIPVPQVKQKTTEERFAALQDAIKPWEFDPEKLVRVGGYAGATPEPTPPAPPFSPTGITDLQLWIDFSDASTLTTFDDGGTTRVSAIQSKVGSFSLTAATTEAAAYITNGGEGSTAALYLDNEGRLSANRCYYETANGATGTISLTSGYTIFQFGKNTSTPTSTGYRTSYPLFGLNRSSTSTTYQSYRGYMTNYSQFQYYYGPLLSSKVFQTRIYDQTPEFISLGSYYNAVGSWNPNMDGYTDTKPYSKTFSGQRYTFYDTRANAYEPKPADTTYLYWDAFGINGYRSASTSKVKLGVYNYEIYEVLMYNRQLTESEIDQVWNYLSAKYPNTRNESGLVKVNIPADEEGMTGTTSIYNYIKFQDKAWGYPFYQTSWGGYKEQVVFIDGSKEYEVWTPNVAPYNIFWNANLINNTQSTTAYTASCYAGWLGSTSHTELGQIASGASSSDTYTLTTEASYDCVSPYSVSMFIDWNLSTNPGSSTNYMQFRADGNGGITLYEASGNTDTFVDFKINPLYVDNIGIYYTSDLSDTYTEWNLYNMNTCVSGDTSTLANSNSGLTYSNSVSYPDLNTCYTSEINYLPI